MGVLKWINRLFSKFEEYCLSWSIIISAIILITNSMGRVMFNRTISSAEEIAQLMLIVMTFMGASKGARLGQHIAMTAVYDMAPFIVKKIFLYIISFGSSVIILYMTYLSTSYVLKVFSLGRVTPALTIPIWIIYAFMPLGFLLCFIQYLLIFILNIKYKNELIIGSEQNIKNNNELIIESEQSSGCIS